jgi:hypothetical protein
MVKFELKQAACEDIDKHKMGDEITVFFNLQGRKWKNKENKDVYFVSVNAWRLEAVKGASNEPPEQYTIPPTGEVDSLPF